MYTAYFAEWTETRVIWSDIALALNWFCSFPMGFCMKSNAVIEWTFRRHWYSCCPFLFKLAYSAHFCSEAVPQSHFSHWFLLTYFHHSLCGHVLCITTLLLHYFLPLISIHFNLKYYLNLCIFSKQTRMLFQQNPCNDNSNERFKIWYSIHQLWQRKLAAGHWN